MNDFILVILWVILWLSSFHTYSRLFDTSQRVYSFSTQIIKLIYGFLYMCLFSDCIFHNSALPIYMSQSSPLPCMALKSHGTTQECGMLGSRYKIGKLTELTVSKWRVTVILRITNPAFLNSRVVTWDVPAHAITWSVFYSSALPCMQDHPQYP